MTVNEFDWVLNSENVAWTLAVNLVQKGGECSGFARAGRTGNENQAVGSLRKVRRVDWEG